MIVKELMSTNVCFVKSEGTAADAAALMKQFDIGFVPVCDHKGCLLGVITDRDILMRAAPNLKTPVTSIMSCDITTVSSDINVHQAASVFAEKQLRRLPVLENGRLAGVLSLCDLARKKVFLAEVGDIFGSLSKKQTVSDDLQTNCNHS